MERSCGNDRAGKWPEIAGRIMRNESYRKLGREYGYHHSNIPLIGKKYSSGSDRITALEAAARYYERNSLRGVSPATANASRPGGLETAKSRRRTVESLESGRGGAGFSAAVGSSGPMGVIPASRARGNDPR